VKIVRKKEGRVRTNKGRGKPDRTGRWGGGKGKQKDVQGKSGRDVQKKNKSVRAGQGGVLKKKESRHTKGG